MRFMHLTSHDLFFIGVTMRKMLHHNLKMLHYKPFLQIFQTC